MMFSAGMGIGLMFYGVAEPLSHYVSPPPLTVEAESSQAIETAMATTLFHWTLHPWAMYAVVGLAIAYGTFRRGRRQLISSVFVPLLGERRAAGPAGRVIDVLAIFATLFGSAASLGLGALQIGSGVEILGWAGERRQRRPGRDHRDPDRRVRRLGRLRHRAWDPVAVQHQHGPGPAARGVRLPRRPDDLHPQPAARRVGQLLLRPR
jgi:hypothetical protein